MALQDCQILQKRLGFGNPSQQMPNIFFILRIAEKMLP
jgi:hypothetical protein